MIWIYCISWTLLFYPTLCAGATEDKRRHIQKREVVASNMNIKIGPECEELGICEDVSDYPDELVTKIVNELKTRNEKFFNKDVLEMQNLEYTPLCVSKEMLFTPRAGRDSYKQWYIIINPVYKPYQTFRVDICSNRDGACAPNIVIFKPESYGSCVQKYILRNMWVLENNKAVEKAIEIPNCCSCLATCSVSDDVCLGE